MDLLNPGTVSSFRPSSRGHDRQKGFRSRNWVGLVVLLGLTLTGFFWRNAREAHQREAQAYLDFRVRDSIQRIQTRLDAYEQALLGGRGLFEAAPTVDRRAWQAYANNLDLQKNFPGIQGLGFSVWVPPEAKAHHIERLRREGFPAYDLRPPGERPGYSSIIFLEPFRDRNLRAFGYDMFSEPVRRQAMETARDENRSVLSGKVKLVQETEADIQAGFLMYIPIYWPGRPLTSVAERRAALRGWVYAPFRMNDFMSGVLGERADDLDLELYNGDFESLGELLFKSRNAQLQAAGLTALAYRGVMTYSGHPWLLKIRPFSSFQQQLQPSQERQTLAMGLLGSLLLGLLTWSLSSGRERAEQLAEERETQFKAIFEQAAVGIALISLSGTILRANRRFCDLLGYSLEGVAAQTIDDLTHPEDREARQSTRARLLGGEVSFFTAETRLLQRNGQPLLVNFTGSGVAGLDGSPAYFMAVIEDISVRKQAETALAESEARLRQVFESSPSAMSLSRVEDGLIRQVNEAWTRLFGWTGQEALGQTLLGIGIYANPEDRLSLRAAFTEQGVLNDWPLMARGKDGHSMHLRLGLTVIEVDGEPCYLTVLLDHSALFETGEALRKLNQTLELQVATELERRLAHERALVHQSRLAAMGEMVGNIAHQWRQPLNALAMVLANLRDAHRHDQLSADYLEATLAQSNALVQKMSTTITDFTDFFRPNKAPTRFPLRAQVQQALQLVLPSLQHHQVAVALEDGAEAWIMGHPNEFSQVLLNLLANAREAIQEAGVPGGLIRIAITTEEASARLRISDNGGGIRIEPLERIFEPYFTDKPTGTGLGLYMSRMILEQSLQASIAAGNIPGGAEFSILIPLSEA